MDYGVLSELDQVPLPNINKSTVGSTIQTYLFPITVIELGEGFVIGTDKVVTKVSGTFRQEVRTAVSHNSVNPGHAAVTRVYLYDACLEVAALRAGGSAVSPGVQISAAGDEVQLTLLPSQQAIILWASRDSTDDNLKTF